MEHDIIVDDHKQKQQKEEEASYHRTATSTRKQGHLNEDLGPAEKRMKPSEFAEYDELLTELSERLKLARHPDSSQLLKAARLLLESKRTQSQLSLSGAELRMLGDDIVDGKQDKTVADRHRAGGRNGADRLDDDEIRTIRQSKFTLNDITLPKTLEPTRVCWIADTGGDCHEPGPGGRLARSEKDELWSALERSARALKLLYLDDQRQLQNQVNELISSIQSITANPKTDPRLLATGR